MSSLKSLCRYVTTIIEITNRDSVFSNLTESISNDFYLQILYSGKYFAINQDTNYAKAISYVDVNHN